MRLEATLATEVFVNDAGTISITQQDGLSFDGELQPMLIALSYEQAELVGNELLRLVAENKLAEQENDENT